MNLPDPVLQLGFATLLDASRDRVLTAALREAVGQVDIGELDGELSAFVPAMARSTLAKAGVRAETFFPVPMLLRAKPALLAYYRLLFGYSQKQFYKAGRGMGLFRLMETKGILRPSAETALPELCTVFAAAGKVFVSGLGNGVGSSTVSDELCLLTLGAQFRGSANNIRGSDGIKAVVAVLNAVFEAEIVETRKNLLLVRNFAGRTVKVEIATDPDVLIRTEMGDGTDRLVVAIEVKAGEDHSNIWNRVGEAEKSHLKIRGGGVAECWTIINDPQAAEEKLRQQSPSTNRFYQLVDLTNPESDGRRDFAARVRDMVGL